jgi:hypothetical protein
MSEILTADEETLRRIADAVKPRRRKLLTTREAASIFNACPETLRRYAKRGLLHPVRYNARRLRWDADELETFLSQGVDR